MVNSETMGDHMETHTYAMGGLPLEAQMQIQKIENTIIGMADSIRKIKEDLEKLKKNTCDKPEKEVDEELEKIYYGCLHDIYRMETSYNGNHYIISKDFFDYCHAKRLQPTMFRDWLYRKGYIAGCLQNGKLLKTKNAYLGDASKRTRCMVLLKTGHARQT